MANKVVSNVASVMVRKSQLLSVEAWRGGAIGLMKDGSFVEGINSRWLVQVLL